MSPLHGVLRPFSDICHTIDVIQVAPDRVCDPARRLVECMFDLKTALFDLVDQSNDPIHVTVTLFHRKSILYPDFVSCYLISVTV